MQLQWCGLRAKSVDNRMTTCPGMSGTVPELEAMSQAQSARDNRIPRTAAILCDRFHVIILSMNKNTNYTMTNVHTVLGSLTYIETVPSDSLY